MINKAVQFIKEVRIEFTKVSWPSREEMVQSTMVVMVVSLIVAAFIGAVDQGLNFLVGLVLG